MVLPGKKNDLDAGYSILDNRCHPARIYAVAGKI
jgi:hypothetical protein